MWVRAPELCDTIALRNALLNTDKLTDEFDVIAMVDRLYDIAKSLALASGADDSDDDGGDDGGDDDAMR